MLLDTHTHSFSRSRPLFDRLRVTYRLCPVDLRRPWTMMMLRTRMNCGAAAALSAAAAADVALVDDSLSF